jgi:AbrB family looped-hinge helix DNA binding protein
MLTTRLSTKGQVVIPRAVRERRRWRPGQPLEIVETDDGVLLRSKPDAGSVRKALDRLGQALDYQGPAVPVERLGIEAIPYRDRYPDEEE